MIKVNKKTRPVIPPPPPPPLKTSGKTKTAPTTPPPPPPNIENRDLFLNQIKSGVSLNKIESPVQDKRRFQNNLLDADGIMGALARALHTRRRQITNSDESQLEDDDESW